MKPHIKFILAYSFISTFFLINLSYAQSDIISDTLDALHYDIHIDLPELSSNTISGYTTILVTPKVNGINTLQLELLQLTVDSVFINNQFHSNFTHWDPLLDIYLSDPINIGDTIEITVHYHGVPFHENWGGFHFEGQFAFNLGVGFVSNPHNLGKAWFPCIDDFHDRAAYDIYVRVEEEMTAVCGGTLVDVENNGDNTKTFHWQMENTIPTYLASVAVGNYVLVEDTYAGIMNDIPIKIYVKPNDSLNVFGSFIHLKDILSVFENRFGPYRWSRVGYVGTDIGAMEHATNIAYPHFTINGNLTYEWLYAHELSHMWFGDLVTCASAEDMWINEGWAVFCESLFREGIYGQTSYQENINSLHKWVLHYCHTPLGDNQYFALYGIPPEYTYGNTVYDKGALVVHTLRGYLGDSLFFAATKGFLDEFAFNYMSSYDLSEFISSYTGVNVTDFFNAWVFSPGFPHFAIDSFSVTPSGSSFLIDVYASQKWKGGDYYANSNNVEITFMSSGWETHTDIIHFSGPSGHQSFLVPFEPALVMADLNDKICDATTDTELTISEPGEYGFDDTFFTLEVENVTDSAFMRVTHNWAPPDTLQDPVNGLRLSDYRYWSIDGVFPDGFQGSGKFFYTKSSFLDNTLITNLNDSLVILYRANPAAEWASIEFTKLGNWMVGNLIVENLQKGDYTLAIWDHTVSTGKTINKLAPVMKIYPNPSGDSFTIELENTLQGRIVVYNTSGKVIDSMKIGDGQRLLQWTPGPASKGTYFIRLIDNNNEILDSEKVLFVN